MTTILELVEKARSRLIRVGLEPDQAGIDAEVLARDTLGWNRATYLANGRMVAPSDFLPKYETVVWRREQREPVSLIRGYREFWQLEFEVTPDVLTPRPETELLVEQTLFRLKESKVSGAHVADIGTGSGCLAVTVAVELPDCQITAVDVSIDALLVARRNAERYGVERRIRWVCAEHFEGLLGIKALSVIMANLPYIPVSQIKSLPPEVRDYEPHGALDGGPDGLDVIRALITKANRHLDHGGWLIVECGTNQSEAVSQHVSSVATLVVIEIIEDLKATPRVLVIQKT